MAMLCRLNILMKSVMNVPRFTFSILFERYISNNISTSAYRLRLSTRPFGVPNSRHTFTIRSRSFEANPWRISLRDFFVVSDRSPHDAEIDKINFSFFDDQVARMGIPVEKAVVEDLFQIRQHQFAADVIRIIAKQIQLFAVGDFGAFDVLFHQYPGASSVPNRFSGRRHRRCWH